MISPDIKRELDELLRFLPWFLRHPIQGMQRAPDWHWLTCLSLQIGLSIVCGVLFGLLPPSFTTFLIGLLFFPVILFFQVSLLAMFLIGYFSVVHSTFLESRRLFTLVVLANVPYTIFYTVSSFVPPIQLIGFACTCVLLLVGMQEHFHIERSRLTRLMFGLFLTFTLLWAITQYRSSQQADRFEDFSVPKSLDTLEEELQQ